MRQPTALRRDAARNDTECRKRAVQSAAKRIACRLRLRARNSADVAMVSHDRPVVNHGDFDRAIFNKAFNGNDEKTSYSVKDSDEHRIRQQYSPNACQRNAGNAARLITAGYAIVSVGLPGHITRFQRTFALPGRWAGS